MTSLPIAGPSPHAVYTGRTTSWPMVATTCAGALLVVLMGKDSNGAWGDLVFVVPLILVAIGVLANVMTASSVRATAGPNGFTIRWGLVGWPRCTYGLDEIEHADVIDLPWWRVSYGFWWTPKRTNCTVRSGPTVQLSLRNQRIVTITVPEPAAAVAALRDAPAIGRSGG
ncbi:MAG: hypothetical protein ABIO83_04995 [Ilumatobacteraceae bacterium]